MHKITQVERYLPHGQMETVYEFQFRYGREEASVKVAVAHDENNDYNQQTQVQQLDADSNMDEIVMERMAEKFVRQVSADLWAED